MNKNNGSSGKTDNKTIPASVEKNTFYAFIKKLKFVGIIWIFLLSVIFAACCFSFVNSFVNRFIRYDDVTITVKEPGAVWISGINGEEPTREVFDSADKVGNWEFRDKAEWEGYVTNHICIYTDTSDSSITIKSQYIGNGKMMFWQNADGALAEISHKGYTQTIDTFSDLAGGTYYSTVIKNNRLPAILLMAAIYLCLVLMISAVICIFLYLLDAYGYRLLSCDKFSSAKLITIIFVITYAFNLINYKLIGIPNLLQFGDQSDYWFRAEAFLSVMRSPHTSDQIKEFFGDYPVFRGYFCYIVPMVSIIAGNLIKLDPFYIFLLINALMTALFFGYVIPGFYELFNNKKPSYTHCFLMLLLFGIFWKGQFYNVLCDYPGVCAFFAGILFFIKFLKDKKTGYAVLCGTLFSVTLAMRTSYIVGVAVVFIVTVVYMIVYRKKHTSDPGEGSMSAVLKKLLPGSAAGLISFLILCIPQMYVNHTKDHIGLFAYDEVGAYVYKDSTLLESSISRSIGENITGYPYPINDKQIAGIRDIAGFGLDIHLKMDESFYAYASSPLDSLLAVFKRTFIILDTKMNEAYPIHSYHKHSYFYLYSTVNYLILGTALYCLVNKSFRKRKLPFNEFLFIGVPSLATFAPILAGAVEWRHGLNIYILAYYIVAFYFFDALADKKQNKLILGSNYFSFITCYVFLSHVLSLTMYA